jgi:hypothetical protein
MRSRDDVVVSMVPNNILGAPSVLVCWAGLGASAAALPARDLLAWPYEFTDVSRISKISKKDNRFS